MGRFVWTRGRVASCGAARRCVARSCRCPKTATRHPRANTAWMFSLGDSLVAFRANDGASAWTRRASSRTRCFRIVPIKQGCRPGYEWFDLLDPATGKSLWRAPVETKSARWDVLRSDTIMSRTKNVCWLSRSVTGRCAPWGTVDFKEMKRHRSDRLETGHHLNSWHNLLLMDRQGTVRYQREVPVAKSSFGERGESAGHRLMRPSTRWAGSHIFFFTGAATNGAARDSASSRSTDRWPRGWDDCGSRPSALVPIDDDVVRVLSPQRFDARALPLLDGADLNYAARNGQAGVVSGLIAGRQPHGRRGDDGWTALHLAALLRSTRMIVRLLIAHGANAGGATREGWTPWSGMARTATTASPRSCAAVPTRLQPPRMQPIPGVSAVRADCGSTRRVEPRLGAGLDAWSLARGAVNGLLDGALAGQANAVLAVCDRAVDRTPSDDGRL